MNITTIKSARIVGLKAVPVTVEVSVEKGIGIHLVGLADAAVKESLLRTITALQSKGFRIPGKKIVINLAPADLHKSGSGYDLPIAAAIISASGQKKLPHADDYIVVGELGLDGSVRTVAGGIIIAATAKDLGYKGVILPVDAARECADIEGIDVYGVATLGEALTILERGSEGNEHLLTRHDDSVVAVDEPITDFADIRGNSGAKRALEIAAAGGHHVILMGAPGSRDRLARALTGILPPMDAMAAEEVSRVYSAAGHYGHTTGLMRQRPFRAPAVSSPISRLLGGGSGGEVTPGEVSLAHEGVLFMDGFENAPASLRESIRCTIEDRKVTIARLRSRVTYPAHLSLVLGVGPCPCGHHGDGSGLCTCSPHIRELYLSKVLSGPVYDNIAVQAFTHDEGEDNGTEGEPSAAIAARVARAWARQQERYKDEDGIRLNGDVPSRQIARLIPVSEMTQRVINGLIERLGLSARSYSHIVRIARTIADLDDKDDILPQHIYEAPAYRFMDRMFLGVTEK